MRKPRVLITAGPTREPLDPVRFISNYSTGVLGIKIAQACNEAGLLVTLIHGPIEVPRKIRARRIPFETVLDLKDALHREIKRADILFMVAAVSDFKPLFAEHAKIKKGKRGRFLNLSLVENPDVLKSIRQFKKDKVYIGFSLESQDLRRHSIKKLQQKGLDVIVAQKVTKTIRPFGEGSVDVMLLDQRGEREDFVQISKTKLARILLKKALALRS